MLGSVGDSSAASESSIDPMGTVGPSDNMAFSATIMPFFFFHACSTLFHFHSFLLVFSLYFFALFQSCCSYTQVFGRALGHEFHIFYSHSQWTLPFSVLLGSTLFWLRSAIKLNTSIIIMIIKRIMKQIFNTFVNLSMNVCFRRNRMVRVQHWLKERKDKTVDQLIDMVIFMFFKF